MAEKEFKLAAFNLTKINVEKKPDFSGKPQAEQNISLKTIESFKPQQSKQETLKVSFNYKIDYKDLGEIELEGDLYILSDAKTIKEILKQWKDKKLSNEYNNIILNAVFQRASIKAIQLEEEFNLPVHIKFPQMKVPESK